MNAARRSIKRRDWPPNLYETRPGYYLWRDPSTRQGIALGYIPLAAAKHQALQANAYIAGIKPTLMDRLTGAGNTVAELLQKMPVAKKPNTDKMHRSIDKLIAEHLGSVICGDLTVKHCADILEGLRDAGKARWAQAVRSRLVAVCKRGMGLGWMDANPAEVTENPQVVVKRERLTLESFKAILAVADQVAEWLPRAMLLGIVTAQDRSTIAVMKRSDVRDVPLPDGGAERVLPMQQNRIDPILAFSSFISTTCMASAKRYFRAHRPPAGAKQINDLAHDSKHVATAFVVANPCESSTIRRVDG